MSSLAERLAGLRQWAVMDISIQDSAPSDIYRKLKENGYMVYGVGDNGATISGHQDPVYSSLAKLPSKPDVVNVVSNKGSAAIEKIIEDCVRIGIGSIWFQPGAANKSMVDKARGAKLQVVSDECILNYKKSLGIHNPDRSNQHATPSLVIRRKRKERDGKTHAPQENFMFHLKLENNKKESKKKKQKRTSDPNSTGVDASTPKVEPTISPKIRAPAVSKSSSSSSSSTGKQANKSFGLASQNQTSQHRATDDSKPNPQMHISPKSQQMSYSNAFTENVDNVTRLNTIAPHTPHQITVISQQATIQNVLPSIKQHAPLQTTTRMNTTVTTPTHSTTAVVQGNIVPEDTSLGLTLNLDSFQLPVSNTEMLYPSNHINHGTLMGNINSGFGHSTSGYILPSHQPLPQFNNTVSSNCEALIHIDGTIIETNDLLCTALGFKQQELKFIRLQKLSHPDEVSSINFLLLQIFSEAITNYKQTLRLIRSDGCLLRIAFKISSVKNENGLVKMVMLAFDKHPVVLHSEKIHPRVQDFAQIHNPPDQQGFDECFNNFDKGMSWLLDRLFGNENNDPDPDCAKPAMFYNREGMIIWNNKNFDILFGVPRHSVLNIRIQDLSNMKGTELELLIHHVLSTLPEHFEFQSPPTPNYSGQVNTVRSYGRRLDRRKAVGPSDPVVQDRWAPAVATNNTPGAIDNDTNNTFSYVYGYLWIVTILSTGVL